MKDSNLELEVDVKQKDPAGDVYADGEQLRLLNLGPMAFVSEYNLTRSSANEKESIGNARIA